MKTSNSNGRSSKLQAKETPIFTSENRPLPSQFELAMIAATLAQKIDDAPDELMNVAVNIWNAAGIRLNSYYMTCVVTASIDNFNGGAIVKRDEFFKALLPQSKRNRTADVGEIGRAFIRYLFFKKFKKKPSFDESSDFYSKWNAGSSEQAKELAWEFYDWYRDRISKAHSVAGRKPKKKKRKARPQREQLKEIVKEIEKNS
jgi:hypothetical protein